MTEDYIDPQVYDLYDEYCHTQMTRREFLNKASALVVVSGSAVAMAEALLPRYAKAQMISFTDERIKATYVDYDSPGGSSGKMRGYLVKPAGDGPFPVVLVVHENRGLNPYIEDVARRAAVEGFLALAPDGLAPIGGYPGNDDDGKVMQKSLDRDKFVSTPTPFISPSAPVLLKSNSRTVSAVILLGRLMAFQLFPHMRSVNPPSNISY